MTEKLGYFIEKSIAENIHHYLNQLISTEVIDNSKSPIIGYKRKDQQYKFATLHGGIGYQSLVLHVNPGNRITTLGKEIQIKIQEELAFDISIIRKHVLKSNEVYIPLEKLLSLKSWSSIKPHILYAYYKQEKELI